MQKIDFMNAVSRFEYIVNMVCREQILLMYKQILSMLKKWIWLLWNSNMKKHSALAFKFRKHDFIRYFMRK